MSTLPAQEMETVAGAGRPQAADITSKSKEPSAFGHEHFAKTIVRRIDQYFEGAYEDVDRGEFSPIIGVLGEWGAGKTHLLNEVGDTYSERAQRCLSGSAPLPNQITLTVTFNAWRQERSSNEVTALLKTIEASLRRVNAKKLEGATELNLQRAKLMKRVHDLGARIGFLGAAFELAPRLFSGAGDTAQNFALAVRLANYYNQVTGDDKEATDRAVNMVQACQFDFEFELRKAILDCNEGQRHKVNLLIMVDDLDRCMPEYSVRLLETLKLFDTVPHVSFVVCYDDEIVERGVRFRYRDYIRTTENSMSSSEAANDRLVAFGVEFLEKIFSLQFRMPQLNELEIRNFLTKRYPAVFSGKIQGSEKKTSGELVRARDLLDLFVLSVPRAPRKLIRAVDLYILMRDMASARGMADIRPLALARLVLLQLYAPEFYRFVRSRPGVLLTLDGWQKRYSGEWQNPSFDIPLEQRSDPVGRRIYELQEKPLLELLRMSDRSRIGLDVRRLVPFDLSDLNVQRYLQLLDDSELRDSEKSSVREYAAPINEGEFFDLLLTLRADSRSSALGMEGVYGRRLTDELFDRMVKILREASRQTLLVDFAWLEDVCRVLDGELTLRFFAELRLLDMFNSRSGADKAQNVLKALTILAKKVNPPHWPTTMLVEVSKLVRTPLSLAGLNLEGAYLRGLDLTGVQMDNEVVLLNSDLRMTKLPANVSPKAMMGAIREGLVPRNAVPWTKFTESTWINCICSPDTRSIVTGGRDGALTVWKIDSDSKWVVSQIAKRQHDWITGLIAVSDSTVVSASGDATIVVWARRSDGNLDPVTTLTGHQRSVNGLALIDKDTFVSVGQDSKTLIWQRDGESDWKLAQTLGGHETWVQAVSSLGGNSMATASTDKSVIVWERNPAGHWRQKQVLVGHRNTVRATCPIDINTFASCGDDNTILIWKRVQENWERGQPLQGHTARVTSLLAWSSDTLISGSSDKSLIVWRKSEKGDWAVEQKLLGHRDWVRCISRIGSDTLLTGGADGFRRWMLGSNNDFTPHNWWLNLGKAALVASIDLRGLHMMGNRLWKTARVRSGDKSYTMPADPEWHEYVFFRGVNDMSIPSSMFLEQIQWDDPDRPRVLTLPWPSSFRPSLLLGRSQR